ncbi:hypothetical protein UA08_07420 [Talaromyces atroroseus]|uniref:DUF7136 domain-containing protein n=1 Tax=Talaromyces atroroseus TaxID=1441469 RepID=A0A225AGK6_TALAT|nr:hypothetical protein UA08_07420 [Talaromyces atroroseus]OKL57254.1 hypothetical protein UA08_07420 [Talaromyces atroroseus]
MMRSIISMAFASIAFVPMAYSTSLTSSPASNTSGIEVDVIFPIHNTTYNVTNSLPIVFALQNLTAAAALGPFRFEWDIMPYGDIGGDQEPGGVTNDHWGVHFDTANATTEPYILINQTDVQKWQFMPRYPYGSVYALQWAITWNVSPKPCDSDPLGVFGTLFFNINMDSTEADLGNLTGQCPQLGAVYEINTTAKNSSCSAVVSNGGAGNPCAVTLDKAMVGNISSTVQSLAASTATASASATSTPSPTQRSIAVRSDIPLPYILVATFLGSLPMMMS